MKDIKLVENVQRRATKFIVNDSSMDYKSRLLQLKFYYTLLYFYYTYFNESSTFNMLVVT